MTKRKPKTEIEIEFLVRFDSTQIQFVRTQTGLEPPSYILRTNDYEFEDEWKEYTLKHEEVIVLATLFGKVV